MEPGVVGNAARMETVFVFSSGGRGDSGANSVSGSLALNGPISMMILVDVVLCPSSAPRNWPQRLALESWPPPPPPPLIRHT